MDHYIQIAIDSLPTAALFALAGLGFVIIYRSAGTLNFAQGQLALLGAYILLSAQLLTGHFSLAFIIVLVATAAVGGVVYFGAVRPAVAIGDSLIAAMITLALSSLLEGIFLLVWGGNNYLLKLPIPTKQIALPGGYTTQATGAACVAAALVVVGVIVIVLRTTSLGTAMRAASENPTLAAQRGVNVAMTRAVAWGFAAVSAALAGIGYGAMNGVRPTVTALGFAAFPAILIGGIDSLLGVLVGAVAVAMAQSYAADAFGGLWADSVGYVLVFVILLYRPQGLFGSKSVVRL